MKGRHTSLDKALKNNILWIEYLNEVSKVVLGITDSCRHKFPPGHIKIRHEVEGGIKVNGYSGNGVMDIFIRIQNATNIPIVINKIQNRYKLK